MTVGKEGLIGRPWGSSWMEGKAEEACLGRESGQEALGVCRVGSLPTVTLRWYQGCRSCLSYLSEPWESGRWIGRVLVVGSPHWLGGGHTLIDSPIWTSPEISSKRKSEGCYQRRNQKCPLPLAPQRVVMTSHRCHHCWDHSNTYSFSNYSMPSTIQSVLYLLTRSTHTLRLWGRY